MPSRPGAGRPRFQPDLAELQKLCMLQCTAEEIAAWFDVSQRTIDRLAQQPKTRAIMDRGRAKGRISVRRKMMNAMDKWPGAAIFVAKNVLGWRDVTATEHSGPDGKAIQIDSRTELISRITSLAARARPSDVPERAK